MKSLVLSYAESS